MTALCAQSLTRLLTHDEAVEESAHRFEDDDAETCRLTARNSEDGLDTTGNTLGLLVERVPQEERSAHW